MNLAERLRQYNRWRRGEEDWPDERGPDPKELGKIIDVAADRIEALESELRVKDLTIGQMANTTQALEAHNAVLRGAFQTYIDEHDVAGVDDWMEMTCSIEAHHAADEAIVFIPASIKEIHKTKSERINLLESDPAIHFCHRFAVVLECMIHSEYPNEFWTEATTLLSEYSEAQDKWREAAGEPYVSGFGKD